MFAIPEVLFPGLTIPYHDPVSVEHFDANNTNALVFFRDKGYRPACAVQIREHIELALSNSEFHTNFKAVY